MQEIADRLNKVIQSVSPVLASLEHVTERPLADKWSKQEILGHLIDSAANNHQRFVRAAYGDAIHFTQYVPDKWVNIQQYNSATWSDLVTLFKAYNLHLCHVIAQLPQDSAAVLCNVGKEEPVTLEFVVKDYLRHLQHHLDQITG